MDGLLVIDKPAGPTSHDVVARLRRVLRERRIGHTGTLDPGATGVLPLVLGRATRLARFLSARDKQYEAVIRLGTATDTYDAHGVPSGVRHQGAWPSRSEIEAVLDTFRGTSLQQPPAFSAKKIEGRRSHRLARAARATSRPDRPDLPAPVPVTAQAIDLTSVEDDLVTLTIDCSAGFYVRSLAHDLGDRLGVGAHLTALRRTRSGDLTVADALPLDVAERDRDTARAAVIPLDRMLPSLSAVVLTHAGARHVAHGRDLGSADIAQDPPAAASPPCVRLPLAAQQCVRLMTEGGQLLGIAEPAEAPGLLHPSVVLV
ncbi:MAG: tRNA pseudouridine(55) synthase TruB [Acidobacteria bacterium]|nr:MAG: tRNA pseudouridine(55) synthase TruB [Acidobacteriota bacterium]